MFMALLGALVAMLMLSRWHDRQIEGIAHRNCGVQRRSHQQNPDQEMP
jgi:hypothetical protein